jgi:hypothetical protein
MAGVCDVRQTFCLALALWNGEDPILKERMFGLAGPEGNHGEDVKECWWYLDSTPTHSWMTWRYHYPQRPFPYAELVHHGRGAGEPEFELVDTGAFADDRYWAVTVDYAKADPTDLCLRISVENRGPDAATLHVLPTLWFRNTWAWGLPGQDAVPRISADGAATLFAEHAELGGLVLTGEPGGAQGMLPGAKRLQLTKTYGGRTGFLQFLQDFAEGSHRFRMDDFPSADPDTLRSGVSAVAMANEAIPAPDDDPLICVQINQTWALYVLDACMSLLAKSTWDSDDENVVVEQARRGLVLSGYREPRAASNGLGVDRRDPNDPRPGPGSVDRKRVRVRAPDQHPGHDGSAHRGRIPTDRLARGP